MNEFANSEIYCTPDGALMIKQENKPVWELKENGSQSRDFISVMLEYMRTFYVEAFEALCKYYSAKEPNKFNYEFWIVSRFLRCNLGEYDKLTIDIDARGRLNFEEVHCPLRGECKLENICCKPKFTTQLSHREMEILRLIVDHYETDEIAERLFLSPHTINNHRRNIHIKTGTRTIAELVEYWHKNALK